VEVQSQNQQLPNPLIFPVPKAEIDEFASLENLANKSPDFTEIETVTTSFTINIPSKEIQLVEPTQKPKKPDSQAQATFCCKLCPDKKSTLEELERHELGVHGKLNKGSTVLATQTPNPNDDFQEKFDAKFVVPNQHVHSVEQNGKTIYTVKKGQPAQISLSNELLDGVYVCIGIFHSHPDYATNQIKADHINRNSFGAPFICQNQNVWYRNIRVPSSAGMIPTTVALIKLQNEKTLDVNFIMNSTDKINMGNLKDAKEWQMMVLPVSSGIAEVMISASTEEYFELSENDLGSLTLLRLQVREEIRREKLVKGHRSLEVTFPLPRNNKRKALEMNIIQAMKKKMKVMTEDQLEEFYSGFE